MIASRLIATLLIGLLISLGGTACSGGGHSSRKPRVEVARPAAPANLVATPGDATVTLQWGAVSGASSYTVYMSTSPNGVGAVPVQSGLTGTSATITGLDNGTVYYFTVRAFNNTGVSPPSNEVAVAPQPPGPTIPIEITKLELAQTHVLPPAGLSWSLTNASEKLHLTGGRDALALMTLDKSDGVNLQLEGVFNGASLGTVAVSPPANLPPSEANGPAYASNTYSAVVPASWMQPGLQLRVSAFNYLPGTLQPLTVGANPELIVRVLPFYLFGANETTKTLAEVLPSSDAIQEAYAKWPVSQLQMVNHSARKVEWSTFVSKPLNGNPAYVLHNASEQRDGFDIPTTNWDILRGLISANGESSGSIQYYAPMIELDSAGQYRYPGTGWGGVSVASGDNLYRGLFNHEVGHAFGLPHQADVYASGRFPYYGGYLTGSVWGYDAIRREFLPTFVPTTSTRYATCATGTYGGYPRQLDSQGRCVKQDPMASGDGDQASGYRFSIFSDYSVGMIQRFFEGRTTLDGSGNHVYSGGVIVADAAFPGGYRRWDTIDSRWVNFTPATQQNGLYGLDGGFPAQVDVPVHAIVITFSLAGTPEVTQIYPLISYTGNLRRYIDPTDPVQRASIVPDVGTYRWFCDDGGCDYTLRVTYANGSLRHVVLQHGFRPFNQQTQAPPASATDPVNSNSFRIWAVNVPGDQPITRIELLDTPMVWNGMPASPTVLASR